MSDEKKQESPARACSYHHEFTVEPHPWKCHEPVQIQSFNEWKTLWHQAKHTELRLGLLHSLTLNDRCWSDQERRRGPGEHDVSALMFLLELADGFEHTDSFIIEGENERHPDSSWYGRSNDGFEAMRHKVARRMIAEKAMQILSVRFFSKKKDKYREDRSEFQCGELFANIELAKKVIHFFRIYQEYHWRTDIMNHCKSPSSDSVQKMIHESVHVFLEMFARTALSQKADGTSRSDIQVKKEVSELLISQKPYFVKIMCHIGKVDCFEGHILDEVTRKTLVDRVMNSEYDLPDPDSTYSSKGRKPVDLREACSAGSYIARILIVERILVAQHAKEQMRIARIRAQDELEAAERKQKEIRDKIAKLEEERLALAAQVLPMSMTLGE